MSTLSLDQHSCTIHNQALHGTKYVARGAALQDFKAEALHFPCITPWESHPLVSLRQQAIRLCRSMCLVSVQFLFSCHVDSAWLPWSYFCPFSAPPPNFSTHSIT